MTPMIGPGSANPACDGTSTGTIIVRGATDTSRRAGGSGVDGVGTGHRRTRAADAWLGARAHAEGVAMTDP
eukprot:12239889-Prorocentrum_lima.AAC.1